MVDRYQPRQMTIVYQELSFNLVIEILMVDRQLVSLRQFPSLNCFNLVIEILMVDRGLGCRAWSRGYWFQSRNRDSYG